MMGLAAWFEGNRRAVDADTARPWRRRYFSPAALGLYRRLIPQLKTYATGRFLDAGCGAMPYRGTVESRVQRYESLDVERRIDGVDHIGDLRDLHFLDESTFDCVLCSEVLEHIPEPDRAVAELYRVLKPGGHVIVTVPFLVRLHEEPSDYFRYTEHGLRFLLAQAGFDVLDITPTGSVAGFLGHQLASIVVGGTYRIPLIGSLALWATAILCTLPCYAIDRGLPSRKLPLGYVAVAVKPPLQQGDAA